MSRKEMWAALKRAHDQQCHQAFVRAVNGHVLLASTFWTPAMTRRQGLFRYAERIGAL